MSGAAIFLGAKKDGLVRLYRVWTYEHADLWPWTLAARSFEVIAEVGIAPLAVQILRIKPGDEATGMLDEPIEEWLDDVKGNARGERLPVHGGTIAQPLPAGLVIDADDMAVDVFRPWVRRTAALPGPATPTVLHGVTLPDGAPAYVHVLRAKHDQLVGWGASLDGILDQEHAGPDQLECWEQAYLIDGRADVLEHSDRLEALLDARAKQREEQRAALMEAARKGDRARVTELLRLGLAGANEIADVALAHGHDEIAADCLEGASLETLRTAVLSALEHERGGLARALLARGGSKLISRVAVGATTPKYFVPLVEHVVALKKKLPDVPPGTDWWPVESVERLARVMPAAVPLVDRTKACHAEETRKHDLQLRLEAAIRADDVTLVNEALAAGARPDASSDRSGPVPLVIAAEVASADVVRLVAIASECSGHDGALPRAITRGPEILGALLATTYMAGVFVKKLLSAPPDDAVSLYRLARRGGFVPPPGLLDNFRSKGPMPPIVAAVLEDFPERRALVEDALARDALVEAIGPEVSWSLLGQTPSLWWKGRLAAWVDGKRVFINVENNDALAQRTRDAGAGDGWDGRGPFRRVPVTTDDPVGLRAWLELVR